MPKRAVRPDCILVLAHFLEPGTGAIQPELHERLKKVVFLQNREPWLRVILNGGQTAGTPRSQGQAMRDFLLEHGVPDRVIIWSEQGHDTFEELNLFVKAMRKHSLSDPYVVTNSEQLWQVRIVFWRLGIPWIPVPTPLHDHTLKYVATRVTAAVLSVFDPRGTMMAFLRKHRATKGQGL